MKSASVVLILYAMSMVFYGSLEMAHDLLHYLADNHFLSLHDHRHDHHHSAHDHHHGHVHQKSQVSHQQDADHEQSIPTVINIFLFVQSKPVFQFHNPFSQILFCKFFAYSTGLDLLPPTPPPKSVIG